MRTKLMIGMMVACFCFAMSIPVEIIAGGVEVSNIRAKKTDYKNGSAWYSIKCTVRNRTKKSGEVYVTLQGLDNRGYELESILLVGNVKANQTIKLTDRSYMDYKPYMNIRKWVVKSVDLY